MTDEAIISDNPQYIILTEDSRYGGNAASVYKRPNWVSIDALKTKHIYDVIGDIMSAPARVLLRVCSVPHKSSTPTSSPAHYRAIVREMRNVGVQ